MQIRAGYEISYDCAHSRDRRPTTVRAECPRATATRDGSVPSVVGKLAARAGVVTIDWQSIT